ncbi:phytochrome sensor signal transduction histidine kinase [Rhizobium sp. RU36D]|nr:phytochrome sensor signal transduction histidine kinase [Rhizobium sp. RU36D]
MTLADTNLDTCAREPIHRPEAIQPHGCLVVLDAGTLEVISASANVDEVVGPNALSANRLGGQLLALEEPLTLWRDQGEGAFRGKMDAPSLAVIAHRQGERLIVELERNHVDKPDDILSRLTGFAQQLAAQVELADAFSAITRFVRELTGFDRTMVYRFDEDWNGQVVAEAGNGALPSYHDLRFPASDIPAQARKLYEVNRVRLIPDATYQPVPLRKLTTEDGEAPLDMTFAQLRSVSPVHLEYMRNMGTLASMSISILVDGKLWGLVSCHSREPHWVPGAIRDACDFVVQSLAMRISAHMASEDAARRMHLAQYHRALLTSMSSTGSWTEGLAREEAALLALTAAAGAAIVVNDECLILGRAPDGEAIRAVARWLSEQGSDLDFFSSQSLAQDMPGGDALAPLACGLLACRVSEFHNSWLLWFRPEVVETVTWGGDPHKAVQETGRIHPRKSFEAWKQLVHNQSLPWQQAEIAAARDLRASIIDIVLKKAEEVAELADELRRSNKELEAFSYSVSHDLRAPFRHIVGFAQLLRERQSGLDAKSLHYLEMIGDSALAAGKLVDDLLHFSQLGRTSISKQKVDMDKLVAEVRQGMAPELRGRSIEWQVGKLPIAHGDQSLLRQVWHNLIDNAVKYTRPRDPARISISGRIDGKNAIYTISDNGVGFDMTYHAKLFGVFQRLQRVEDFEGTGIGLALVRRILERHQGSISAEGEIDKGASFTFTLPIAG